MWTIFLFVAVTIAEAGITACTQKSISVRSVKTSLAGTERSQPIFRENARKAGIDFTHDNGATGKDRFIEFAPGGCAFFDFDNDGFLDILLIQSGSSEQLVVTRNNKITPRPLCALYRNRGDGTFADVTKGSGLDRDLGYLIGVAVCDYDNDGEPDLFLTGYRKNFLFHQSPERPGIFEDVTAKMHLDKLHGAGFATSAAFGDYNNDGKPDLYVCYYSDWVWGKDGGSYSQTLHNPETHRLYRNDGAHFTDVSETSGITHAKGRGLAVGFLDFDGDGWQDIFVANDQTPQMLWRNNHHGGFDETAKLAGCAYSAGGQLMAGMCVAISHYDHGILPSIFVTNRVGSPNTLFRNIGESTFHDASVEASVPAYSSFSFGAEFLDYDADGNDDLIVANGMVNDRNQKESYGSRPAQAKNLYRNIGDGRFQEITSSNAMGELSTQTISRGLAIGDYDNDGRVDCLISNQNAPIQLFHNNDNSHHHAVIFKTIGVKSTRDGLHARFTLTTEKATQIQSVRAGSSYLSASDRRVFFGLGDASRIDSVEIDWPSGIHERLTDLAPDHIYTVTEGKGVTNNRPFSQRR